MKKLKKHFTSEDEKRLVGYLVKKKKAKRVNVYFNKKTDGVVKYFNGKFYSTKNKTTYTYRSSYELKCFQQLERDNDVDSYLSEGMSMPYKDSKGVSRTYVPDLLVLYSNGSMCVFEIKPQEMVKDADVQLKAEACRKYLKETFTDTKVGYKFLTENELFTGNKDYLDFLKNNRGKDFSQELIKKGIK